MSLCFKVCLSFVFWVESLMEFAAFDLDIPLLIMVRMFELNHIEWCHYALKCLSFVFWIESLWTLFLLMYTCPPSLFSLWLEYLSRIILHYKKSRCFDAQNNVGRKNVDRRFSPMLFCTRQEKVNTLFYY